MPTTTKEQIVLGAAPNPASPNHASVTSSQDARSGFMLGRMRWVLAISLATVVVALTIIIVLLR